MNPSYTQFLLDRTRENYNRIAKHFSSTRSFLWPELESFKKYLKENDVILDAGCGNGRLFELFQDLKVDYYGVDFSEVLIKEAQKRYPQANFQKANILDLPFDKEKFNIVFCIATFHHLPSEEARLQVLENFHWVLKPKGYLILTVWNLWQSRFWKYLFQYTTFKILGHSRLDFKDIFFPWKDSQGKIITQRYCHTFDKNELNGLFQLSRFEILDHYYTKGKEKSNWLKGHNLVIIGKK